jgi:hypothetical protein
MELRQRSIAGLHFEEIEAEGARLGALGSDPMAALSLASSCISRQPQSVVLEKRRMAKPFLLFRWNANLNGALTVGKDRVMAPVVRFVLLSLARTIAIWAFNMPSGSRSAAEIGMSGSSGTVWAA